MIFRLSLSLRFIALKGYYGSEFIIFELNSLNNLSGATANFHHHWWKNFLVVIERLLLSWFLFIKHSFCHFFCFYFGRFEKDDMRLSSKAFKRWFGSPSSNFEEYKLWYKRKEGVSKKWNNTWNGTKRQLQRW